MKLWTLEVISALYGEPKFIGIFSAPEKALNYFDKWLINEEIGDDFDNYIAIVIESELDPL